MNAVPPLVETMVPTGSSARRVFWPLLMLQIPDPQAYTTLANHPRVQPLLLSKLTAQLVYRAAGTARRTGEAVEGTGLCFGWPVSGVEGRRRRHGFTVGTAAGPAKEKAK